MANIQVLRPFQLLFKTFEFVIKYFGDFETFFIDNFTIITFTGMIAIEGFIRFILILSIEIQLGLVINHARIEHFMFIRIIIKFIL